MTKSFFLKNLTSEISGFTNVMNISFFNRPCLFKNQFKKFIFSYQLSGLINSSNSSSLFKVNKSM